MNESINSGLELLQAPYSPIKPIKKSKIKYFIVGFLLSFIFGFGILFIKKWVNDIIIFYPFSFFYFYLVVFKIPIIIAPNPIILLLIPIISAVVNPRLFFFIGTYNSAPAVSLG